MTRPAIFPTLPDMWCMHGGGGGGGDGGGGGGGVAPSLSSQFLFSLVRDAHHHSPSLIPQF